VDCAKAQQIDVFADGSNGPVLLATASAYRNWHFVAVPKPPLAQKAPAKDSREARSIRDLGLFNTGIVGKTFYFWKDYSRFSGWHSCTVDEVRSIDAIRCTATHLRSGIPMGGGWQKGADELYTREAVDKFPDGPTAKNWKQKEHNQRRREDREKCERSCENRCYSAHNNTIPRDYCLSRCPERCAWF
jgi:hypothetical protein